MFKQNCFIRLSKPEIVDRLHRLGGRQGTHFWYSNNLTLLVAESDKYYCLDDEWGNAENLIKKGFIDCQDHEELFIALAALRNDTDRNQWFICQEDYLSFHGLKPINKGDWQLNTEYDKLTYGLKRLWRKATAKEILKNAILYV